MNGVANPQLLPDSGVSLSSVDRFSRSGFFYRRQLFCTVALRAKTEQHYRQSEQNSIY